jgi:hypothetical protein
MARRPRAVAIVPAAIAAILYGARETARLRSGRRVIRPLHRSLAVVPRVTCTCDTYKRGEIVHPNSLTLMTHVVTTGIASRHACLQGQTVRAMARHDGAAIARAHVANGLRSRSP